MSLGTMGAAREIPNLTENTASFRQAQNASYPRLGPCFKDYKVLTKPSVRLEQATGITMKVKLGLLLSAVRARNDPSNSHMQGSELIRALTYRLGNAAQLLFVTTGKPTLIKCRIPIEWLDSLTTFPVSNAYINQVLTELINKRICPNDHYIGFRGAYMLTRSVPPECILEFIDMTNFRDDEP